MKKCFSVASALIFLAALSATAALAGSFSLYGAYWDTDEADDTLGGGLTFAWGLSEVIDLELRAGYFQELTNNAFDDIDLDDDFFLDDGLEAIPVELGLRFHLGNNDRIDPYVSAGASYFLLDSDSGEIDDEVGFYGAFGIQFGDDQGAAFFIEATYRQAEATVEIDPDAIDDLDDLEFDSEVGFDLDGVGLNLGVTWSW